MGPPDDAEPDPLIEALVRDVDLTLIRRNLALTPQERLDQLVEMQRFAAELAEAGRRALSRNDRLPPKDILALGELEAILRALSEREP